MLYIGCHLSSSKGFLAMGKTAVSIGANTFQFFTRNPRGGSAKELDLEDVKAYLDYAREHGIGRVVAHAPYTMNLCSADPQIREFAKNTMREDLERLEHLPGNYYNFHPGSHVKQGLDQGIAYICQALDEVMTADFQTTVLLETMAGKGSEIGRSFEELRRIIDQAEYGDRLGVCLDTCHVHDGGYDIVCHLDRVLDEFDRIIGIERLKAVHLNDTKNPLGSRKDRHEKIGLGMLGNEAIQRIVNHPMLRELPFELETPNELDGYAQEIKIIKGMRFFK